jgi:DNA-binding XRE family transcriptional regulator/mRNA-degrading endonuclease YafQ of YafQ-DinJ toxin-antitoxin module
MVYFIKSQDKIKIGYSNNPKQRISNISTSNPFDLEVLLIINGGFKKEMELHKQFQDFRSKGEWFDYNNVIENYIKENMEFDRKEEFVIKKKKEKENFDNNEQILRIRTKEKYSMEQVGNKIGISKQGIKDMENREKDGRITIKKMILIADALGYKFEYRFIKE